LPGSTRQFIDRRNKLSCQEIPAKKFLPRNSCQEDGRAGQLREDTLRAFARA
jgi:hypothetical protein